MKLITNDARKTTIAEIIATPKFGFKRNGKGEFAGMTQEQAAGIGMKVILEEVFTDADAKQKSDLFGILLAICNVSALRQEFEAAKKADGTPLLGKSEGGRGGLDATELANKWSAE